MIVLLCQTCSSDLIETDKHGYMCIACGVEFELKMKLKEMSMKEIHQRLTDLKLVKSKKMIWR